MEVKITYLKKVEEIKDLKFFEIDDDGYRDLILSENMMQAIITYSSLFIDNKDPKQVFDFINEANNLSIVQISDSKALKIEVIDECERTGKEIKTTVKKIIKKFKPQELVNKLICNSRY